MVSKLAAGFLFALALGQAARADPPAAWLQADVDAIHDIGVPGVAAEVVDGAHQVATSGVSSLASGKPMPVDAHFHIASNTKTFVAVVILQLAGEGRLSLDDTVERWLPGLVQGAGNDGRRIRIRNLLQHTSGLVDYGADLPIRSASDWERERLRAYAPQELVAMSMKHRPAWSPTAGETRFSYSNVNYVLAGMIIEKATGRSWREEVRERIVRPLKLSGTFAPEGSPDLPPPFVDSYVQFRPDEPMVETTSFNPTVVASAGAMISTTRDMNAFLRALIGGELLRPAQMAEMERTIDAAGLHDLYPGARYGLGLIWRPLSCGGGYWSHVGEGAAGATRDGVTPDGRRSVVVFMSSELTAPEKRIEQERRAAALIDRALCSAR